MTFYVDPAFFVFVAIAVIPAIVLGFMEKPLRSYGLVVSVLFIILLFHKDLASFAAFLFYLALSTTMAMLYQKVHSEKKPSAKMLYPVALVCAIAPLVIYKVSAVFDGNLLGFLGISYITFKTVQVIIETHDNLITDMRVRDYFYFLIFFSPFTSGPIMRSREFVKDVQRVYTRGEYQNLLAKGVLWFVLGAFYKMVCASLFSVAIWAIPKALGDTSLAMDMLGQIGSAYAYGFYLFFDFAGYSFMAMGVGAAFGINMPRNFKAPFISIDIKDFWNRWHITLSFWLRDFVFMRLVRTIRRKKLISSRLTTTCVAYLANMTLMGLWHGLTPHYIAYGFYHGALLALNELFQKTSFYKRVKDKKAYKVISWLVTFNLIMVGFALFSGQIPLGG
ncbi:MAG: D-alanyl-lipoteichoic acid biosynthesis protein DltB [Raoultibacter sp.]